MLNSQVDYKCPGYLFMNYDINKLSKNIGHFLMLNHFIKENVRHINFEGEGVSKMSKSGLKIFFHLLKKLF